MAQAQTGVGASTIEVMQRHTSGGLCVAISALPGWALWRQPRRYLSQPVSLVARRHRRRRRGMTMTRFVRVNEVAQRFGVHRATVYRKVADGELPPPVRLSGSHGQRGGAVAWPESEVDAYARRLVAARDSHYAQRDRKPAAKRGRGRPRKTAAAEPQT